MANEKINHYMILGLLSHEPMTGYEIKKRLPILKSCVEQLKNLDEEEVHTYYMLTAMFGVKVYEAYLKWCQEAKHYLEQREK